MSPEPTTHFDPDLPREFRSRLWGRCYRVDSDGITVLGRQGQMLERYAWPELQSLGRWIRTKDGRRHEVKLLFEADRFTALAVGHWKRIHPEEHAAAVESGHRQARHIFLHFLPLHHLALVVSLLLVAVAIAVWEGRGLKPGAAQEVPWHLAKAVALALLGVLFYYLALNLGWLTKAKSVSERKEV